MEITILHENNKVLVLWFKNTKTVNDGINVCSTKRRQLNMIIWYRKSKTFISSAFWLRQFAHPSPNFYSSPEMTQHIWYIKQIWRFCLSKICCSSDIFEKQRRLCRTLKSGPGNVLNLSARAATLRQKYIRYLDIRFSLKPRLRNFIYPSIVCQGWNSGLDLRPEFSLERFGFEMKQNILNQKCIGSAKDCPISFPFQIWCWSLFQLWEMTVQNCTT